MIYSVVLNLEPEHDAEVSANLGYQALSLFLDLIRTVDEPLSVSLHGSDGPKPFTASQLQGRLTRRKDSVVLRSGSQYWLRFTLLDETLFAAFMKAILKPGLRLSLGGASLRLVDIITYPQASPWAGFATFDGIMDKASADRSIALYFASPTTFRSGGKRNVAFPSPRLLFGSLNSRWEASGANGLASDVIDQLAEHVQVTRYRLETRMLPFGDYSELGFTGHCVYSLDDALPEQSARALNALADFAFYSGTGAKTTMGMGQTRRLNHHSSRIRGSSSKGD